MNVKPNLLVEPCIAGAYWGPRPTSLDVCAKKLAETLQGLGQRHEVLRTWFRRADTKAEALKTRVPMDVDGLRELLARGRNYTDVGHQVIQELGFSASAWNGDDATPATFSVACGGSSPWVPNKLVVDLPPPAGIGAELYQLSVARSLMTMLIEMWNPDWATFASRSMHVGEQERQRGGPRVGWLTYLSTRFGELPLLGLPTTVEEISGKGSLIVAAPTYAHVTPAIVEKLAETLRSKGVFNVAA